MTCGGEISNSKPSRRMFSIRMPRCSAPRPDTTNASAVSPGSTRSARLRSSSRSRRSLMLRDVTNLPSLPANGDVLTLKTIDTVGPSTSIVSSGIGVSRSQMVSPIAMSEMPVIAAMSPACTSSTGTFAKLLYTYSSLTFAVRTWSGVRLLTIETAWPFRIVPDTTRPIAMRPRCLSKSMLADIICSGESGRTSGAGTSRTTVSNSGCSVSASASGLWPAMPRKPDAYTTGKSICSSLAPRSIISSKT
mmetsp:Transcript_37956/g.112374  ORF Transcript_37956/g.112374 Transcript_37956/m.112374 type:complete len:248 (+) Transcript_37956:730-1473(+)